ncbi:hypothetical protein [Rhodococcus sp. 14-2470-1a]|uniref:hypothetical protein n=1 Tax=Rhodococcus sp. 14-2470-1a TaxID=2023150 RepID=UPI000B9B802E|nr:hypothetical protein [Rhodococcus sp. 14-2470-1a]OZF41901.1 hypothetical protein CH292_27225 [Rhodococcus sp. 14-2470-1a]
MRDTYSALDTPRCSDCDAALTWQLDPVHAELCAPCDRRLTRAAIRRHIDAAAARHAHNVHRRHMTQLAGLPYIDAGTIDDALAPLGVGAFRPQSASQPDGSGLVAVLSPRRVTTHHARARVTDAGGAL